MPIAKKQLITIGFDARLSGQRHAGIGRYIENLLVELVKQKPDFVKFVIFFHDKAQEKALQKTLGLQIDNKSWKKKYQSVFVPIRHYSFAEQFHWPKILAEHKLDLLHIPHFNVPLFYRGRIVITIHDLLWHEQIGPEATTLPIWKYYFKYLAYRIVTNRALSAAEKIFVPTKEVKKVLGRYRPSAKKKTVITYEGISQPFSDINRQLITNPTPALNRKFNNSLIYVGSLYPHKNIGVVLKALKNLPNVNLKIVCARNVFMKRTREKVNRLGLNEQVKFAGYLEDDELIESLQSSLALIQPSKSEGFGLTAIEAMAVGTPVIASNLPVFKEVYGTAPLYFSPDNSDQLVKLIKKIQDNNIRQNHIKKGLKVAQKFSWSKTAKTTLNHYLSLIS